MDTARLPISTEGLRYDPRTEAAIGKESYGWLNRPATARHELGGQLEQSGNLSRTKSVVGGYFDRGLTGADPTQDVLSSPRLAGKA